MSRSRQLKIWTKRLNMMTNYEKGRKISTQWRKRFERSSCLFMKRRSDRLIRTRRLKIKRRLYMIRLSSLNSIRKELPTNLPHPNNSLQKNSQNQFISMRRNMKRWNERWRIRIKHLKNRLSPWDKLENDYKKMSSSWKN